MPAQAQPQHSVARLWNEAVLHSIRNDFARPTVHARNLFHSSILMYDAWALFDEQAETYFLGKTVGPFHCPLQDFPIPEDIQAAREEIMSYAVYRLIRHRFQGSPGKVSVFFQADSLMRTLGYDTGFTATDYTTGDPAALGNYLAEQLILFGLQDGSNEQNDYGNRFYGPVNEPLLPMFPGNPDITRPDRWQPLTLSIFIDQSGNIISNNSPPFLSPEWGEVLPFALQDEDLSQYERNGYTYRVYHDPGPPPFLQGPDDRLREEYKWGFSLVALWSAHLDPADSVVWDISPGSIGNNPEFPASWPDLRSFYHAREGGDPGRGHAVNPHTGRPYEPQLVPRGDYTRVLAEFWADGPDSETPPGHWFTILNYVSDHPLLEKRFQGTGEVLGDLEWDVKAYFALGGAMHDAAVSAWGIKGWYDYIRPISAIRYMADQGQSSDPDLPNYSPDGLPLVPGFIELVEEGDPLAGFEQQNAGKIKVFAWKGPAFIGNPAHSAAGVGWILAENWWPYQRPSFVTPNFAGYVSGHSTFSRAAAEVLTSLTGDPFFPGGMGEFHAPKNEFLVFEEGPSVDVTLQWATYRDASDQTSLSRIWGGIHPPADDIPGRRIGERIGREAFQLATAHFDGEEIRREKEPSGREQFDFFPNPARKGNPVYLQLENPARSAHLDLFNFGGQKIRTLRIPEGSSTVLLSTRGLPAGLYGLVLRTRNGRVGQTLVLQD